jgi:O-antigen/teichoic acid export membrane protein
MSRFKKNVLFNLLGTGWGAVIQFAFIPLYLRILGIEAYGLVAFAVTLQVALQILDFGLSPTMNREMARFAVTPDSAADARDFVRTVEVGYWGVGLAMGGLLVLGAPLISTSWLKVDALGGDVVTRAVMLMGVMTAFQWPFSLYQGGLVGLQRQGVLNGITMAANTLQHGGVVLALLLIAPTVTVFFAWRAAVFLLQVLATMYFLWRSLPPADRPPRFNTERFRTIWKFAAGMSGITLTGIILSQTDKVMLSKLVPLGEYGYYMLASTVANGLMQLIAPVYNAIFPVFAGCVATGDEDRLRGAYHLGAQLLAVLVLPIAIPLVVFGQEALLAWTGNGATAVAAAPILSILAAGTALNGLMFVPYALQLAYGCTSLGLKINVIFILFLVPSVVLMATKFGPKGAAVVWVVLNAVYMIVGVPLTHRRMLRGEAVRWFLDIVPAAVVCLAVALLARFWFDGGGRMIIVMQLATVFIISIVGAALVSGRIRGHVMSLLK